MKTQKTWPHPCGLPTYPMWSQQGRNSDQNSHSAMNVLLACAERREEELGAHRASDLLGDMRGFSEEGLPEQRPEG